MALVLSVRGKVAGPKPPIAVDAHANLSGLVGAAPLERQGVGVRGDLPALEFDSGLSQVVERNAVVCPIVHRPRPRDDIVGDAGGAQRRGVVPVVGRHDEFVARRDVRRVPWLFERPSRRAGR